MKIKTLDSIKYNLGRIYADNTPIKDLKLDVQLNGIKIPYDEFNKYIDYIINGKVEEFKVKIISTLVNELKDEEKDYD